MENQGIAIHFLKLTLKKGRSILISTFFVVSALLFCACSSQKSTSKFQFPDSDHLQTGDLVFRIGRSIESHTVTTADNASIYSHVGILLWTGNGWKVLHAVPNERASKQEKDSVKLESLEVFFHPDRATKGGVYRPPINIDDTLKLLQKGLEIHQRHLLFDNSFNDKDSNAFYCTELVWFIYLSTLDIDLSQGRRHHIPIFPDLIFCSDILAYPEMEEIYKF